MRKILFTLCMCFALCSCHSQFGITYGVKLQGDGDGQVHVTFPEGSYEMDGNATIALQVGDSLPLGKVTSKAYVLEHGSARELAALQAVSNSVTNQFDATAVSGIYDIYLYGYIKETLTGLVFEINRHWTNKYLNSKKSIKKPDPYPFIK